MSEIVPVAVPVQAETDAQLIAMWLNGRSRHTVRAYGKDAEAFLEHAEKPLRAVTVGDIQAFGASLAKLASATQARRLSSVKSLLTYAHRLGYIPFNTGAAVLLPAIEGTLAQRIMEEHEVHRMIALETDLQARALLRLLYAAGARISEAAGLRWRNLVPRSEGGGQVSIYGKGGKTRVVLLPASIWREVMALRGDAGPADPVFRSSRGSPISISTIHRMVKAAAARAGLPPEVSTHWLRHAHASHALSRGCPVHVVQADLGHASVATTGRYLHARPTDSSARYLAV